MICCSILWTGYYSAKVSQERWDIVVYEGRQGYDTGGPPLCRQNGSKTRARLKMKKIRDKKLVLWNYPPKSVSTDAVAGRHIFPIFLADFRCFWCFQSFWLDITPPKCPQRDGTLLCMKADRGTIQYYPPYRGEMAQNSECAWKQKLSGPKN